MRTALQLGFLGLALVALARTSQFTEPQVLDEALHHLGDSHTPDWTEAPAVPEGFGLEFTFQSRALPHESTLEITHGHVDETWHLELNGTRVGTLDKGNDLLPRYYTVPPGTLRNGPNQFRLVGTKSRDDILVGRIRLHGQPLRGVLGLRPVSVHVRDAATGAALPARVTVLASDGSFAPLYFAERLQAAVRRGVCYQSDGAARFEVPAGRYTVYATRGTEWSLGTAQIDVGAATNELQFELRREVDTTGFVAVDTHIHTLTFSGHGDATLEERLVTLAGEGVELAVATDHNHNTDYRPDQERMGLTRYFTPVVGNEVTTPIGHFNAFPLDPAAVVPPHELHDVAELVRGMRERGALAVILNHPRWPEHDTGPYGVAGLDRFTGASSMPHPYDAIEVINSDTDEKDQDGIFRDWFALLDRGETLSAVGSSDSHTVDCTVGGGRTYVRSSSDDPAALDVEECARNVARGKSSIGMGFFVDVTVRGGHSMGDLVTGGAGATYPLSLRVAAASWLRPERAQVFANGALLFEREVPHTEGNPTDVRLDFELPAREHDAWVVCVVHGAGVRDAWWPQLSNYTVAATNPVFLDGDGDGRYSSPRATAARLLEQAGHGPETLRNLLGRLDSGTALQALDLAREAYLSDAGKHLEEAAAGVGDRLPRVRAWLDGKTPP